MAGRKRVKGNLSLPEIVTNEKHFTKKEMAMRNTYSGPVCPPVPMKLRRSNGRKLFNFHEYAVPIYFQKKLPLSKIYNKDLKISYMEQVFENRVKVGEGSFGNVYRARSKEDNEYYAIKVAKNNHKNYSEKFGEVLRLEKIEDHERCVKYFLAWEEQGHLYIQLELCMTSLDKFAQQNHYIPEQQMWDILVDMLEALKHLHDRNLIHLDIKPENIMITSEGTYKLGDFGLLLDLDEFKDKKKQQRSINVSEGDSKYLAAEVLQGKYTKASDVFSLGISMLELATDLMLPTNGPLWHQLRSGIYPKFFEENISSSLKIVIEKMMNPEYLHRPSVNQLFKTGVIKKIISEREKGMRENFVVNWKDSNENCINENLENANIPVIFIKEPPLCNMNVEYSDSDLRCPFKEIDNFDDDSMSISNNEDISMWMSPGEDSNIQSSTPIRARTPDSGLSRVKLFSV